jgi:hypothetical protein
MAQGFPGYGRRVSSGFGRQIIANTLGLGVIFIDGDGPRHYPAGRRGIWKRGLDGPARPSSLTSWVTTECRTTPVYRLLRRRIHGQCLVSGTGIEYQRRSLSRIHGIGFEYGLTAFRGVFAGCSPRGGTKMEAAVRGPEMGNRKTRKYWSGEVTQHSNALDLEPSVFTWNDPKRIARSLSRSAEQSSRRKGTSLQSAMSMLNFYINRAGTNLSGNQRKILEQAKDELRKLFRKA